MAPTCTTRPRRRPPAMPLGTSKSEPLSQKTLRAKFLPPSLLPYFLTSTPLPADAYFRINGNSSFDLRFRAPNAPSRSSRKC